MTRVGFCCLWDATDPNRMSGYAHAMRQQLRASGHDVVDMFPLEPRPKPAWRLRKICYRGTGRYHHWEREPAFLASIAQAVERASRQAKVDVLFAPSSLPVSGLDGAVPVVFSTDQVFPSLLDAYVSRPAARYVQHGHAQEVRALQRAQAAIYPSAWAIDEAVTRCGADRAKLHLVNWGANLPRAPDDAEVERFIAQRRADDGCSLVFIGRDWRRKGGDVVVATVRALNAQRFPCRLTIIGARPPGPLPDNVEVIPFLDKFTPSGWERFTRIMARADFLFVPSRAEAYGQVFCEAAAFGVPAIATAVGGIPSIIREGLSGFCLPLASGPEAFARLIAGQHADRDRQAAMALAARREYGLRLNWPSFGRHVARIIAAQLG